MLERALIGVWEVTALEVGGGPVTVPLVPWVWVFWPGTMGLHLPDRRAALRWTADAAVTPHHLDLIALNREGEPLARGIFVLDDDTLSVCLDFAGGTRPVTFATTPADGYTLVRLRPKA